MTTFVFDTNVVVSATLSPLGTARRALTTAQAFGRIALSEDVFREIEQVLRRPKFIERITAERRNDILATLLATAVWVDPVQTVTDCRDAKDNRYLELAFASAAAAIVSGDDDLLVLDPWRDIRIMQPASFLSYAEALPL